MKGTTFQNEKDAPADSETKVKRPKKKMKRTKNSADPEKFRRSGQTSEQIQSMVRYVQILL